jgi:hypothetical protein
MPTKRAVLLAWPDQQSRLAFRAGDFNEFDAFSLGHLLKKDTEPVTPPGLGEMTIPVPMGSFEVPGEKLAVTFRDACECYAHSETGATLIGSEDRRPDHLGDSTDRRVIGWLHDQPKIPLQRRGFLKGDERTNWTHIFNLALNLGLRGKYSSGPFDYGSRVSPSFFDERHLGWSLYAMTSKV